jgi:hypothetical protein
MLAAAVPALVLAGGPAAMAAPGQNGVAAAAAQPAFGNAGFVTDVTPTMTYIGGTLYAAAGQGTDLDVFTVNPSTGSASLSASLTPDRMDGVGPAMSSMHSLGLGPIIAFASTTGQIEIGYFAQGALQCETPTGQTTANRPYLATTGHDGFGTLYLAWTGTNSARNLNIEPVTAGTCNTSSGQFGFGSKSILTDSSIAGPAMAPDSGGKMWMYWDAGNSAHNLDVAVYDGTTTKDLGAVFNESANEDVVTYCGTDSSVFFAAYTGNTFDSQSQDGTNTCSSGVGAGYDYVTGAMYDTFRGTDNPSHLNIDET